jgi:hypothetical protein
MNPKLIKMKPVISSINLATAVPFWKTLIVVLTLKEFHAPLWLWIVALFVFSIIWLVCCINISREQEVDVFPADEEARDYYDHPMWEDATRKLHTEEKTI